MKNIEHITKKYWEGETSLQEERQLKEYYSNQSELQTPEQALFQFFDNEKRRTTDIQLVVPKQKVFQLRRMVFSIAASLILVVSAFWVINNNSRSGGYDYVVEDPEVALEITKGAFALLNSKMEKGEQTLKDNIVHLEKTLIFKNL